MGNSGRAYSQVRESQHAAGTRSAAAEGVRVMLRPKQSRVWTRLTVHSYEEGTRLPP